MTDTEDRGFEFRLSPDRRQIAIWEPGNEPWFIPQRNMPGRWVTSADMDAMGWTRYVRHASDEQAAAPLDLDAARFDIHLIDAYTKQPGRLAPTQVQAVCEARDRVADIHAPALLARVDELEAHLPQIREDMAAAHTGLNQTRELLDQTRAMAERTYGTEAHPPEDAYRIELHDPATATLPEYWQPIGRLWSTSTGAVEALRRKRAVRPEFGLMRVVCTQVTAKVVYTEVRDAPSEAATRPPAARTPDRVHADLSDAERGPHAAAQTITPAQPTNHA